MKIEVLHIKSGKTLCTLEGLTPESTITAVKQSYAKKNPKYYVDRQQFKLSQDRKAKGLNDEDTLESLGVEDGGRLYFKDLGTQIGWSTVFLAEYAGPLIVYLLFYIRPSFIYGPDVSKQMHVVVHIAAACWTAHYAKRILETIFVHRFSHNTMPIRNLFKNCTYYWGSAALVSYFTNHPLYTPPYYGFPQIWGGLLLFVVSELGNLSIHVALRNLRPPGTKERKIPRATSNPFTFLFNFVSCPNYTYEGGSWMGFAIMTQSLPAFFFFFGGFYQMAVWAQGKHQRYKKEFKDYPRIRKAIVPFLI